METSLDEIEAILRKEYSVEVIDQYFNTTPILRPVPKASDYPRTFIKLPNGMMVEVK
jgi:hypothetical protein